MGLGAPYVLRMLSIPAEIERLNDGALPGRCAVVRNEALRQISRRHSRNSSRVAARSLA
jgi:hypothetical protein